MSQPNDPLAALVQELHHEATAAPAAVMMTAQPVVRESRAYSHEAMVDLMVEHPTWTHSQLSMAFGRPPSWMSAVLASDAFQAVLEPRRHLVLDPALTATIDERLKGLAIRAVTVLQEKLNTTGVSDLVVLKAAEIGVKAHTAKQIATTPQLPAPVNTSQSVAEKLLEAMDKRDRARANSQAIDVDVREVSGGQ